MNDTTNEANGLPAHFEESLRDVLERLDRIQLRHEQIVADLERLQALHRQCTS